MQETALRPAPGRARRLLTVAFLLVFAAPLAVAIAGLSGVGHRWVDILAQFVAPAAAGTVALALVAALLRDRLAVAAGLTVLGLLFAAGWPQWVPDRGQAQAGSPELTLYSANLHARNEDVEAMARSVAEAEADIIVLIEVGDAAAAALDRILPEHPHRAVNGRLDRPSGPARSLIASRRPLRNLDLSIPQLFVVGAVVQTDLGPVTVAGPHFTRPWPYQFQWGQIIQAQGLTDWVRTVKGPVIVAGDFNSVSSARIGQQVRADGGLIAAPGWPGTWPSALPSFAGMTIDQVYRTPDLALVERRLGLPTGSDHRPVLTRFVRAAPEGG